MFVIHFLFDMDNCIKKMLPSASIKKCGQQTQSLPMTLFVYVDITNPHDITDSAITYLN